MVYGCYGLPDCYGYMVAMAYGCYGYLTEYMLWFLWLLWLHDGVHVRVHGCYGLLSDRVHVMVMVAMVYGCYGYLTEYMLWLWLLWFMVAMVT